MTAPHIDDLRAALHEAEVGVDQLRRAIELAAHGQENGPEVTAAAERFDAVCTTIRAATNPRCGLCRDTGRVADDEPCRVCEAGARLMNVPVGKPTPEVTG